MKLLIVIAAAAAFAALSVLGVAPRSAHLRDSKTQPKHVVLNKNPKTAKSPDKELTPFNHETHTLRNYSPDMKSRLACAECHHTDQPKAALKGVLKTSEREEALTAAVLEKPDAKPVKSCASCHAQPDDKPPGWAENPKVTYEDGDEVVLTREEAYHRNCNVCHEAVKKLKADTKAPTACAQCHSGKTTSGEN
jgi:Class III cytochrome C family